MATVNFIKYKKQSAATLRGVIGYVCQINKTGIDRAFLNKKHWENEKPPLQTQPLKLISGINCTPETAYSEFISTKASYNKMNDTQFYHYTQSFKDGENISPKTAHEIALRFAAEHYKDFEVVVATHMDNQHLHIHFIINSVSFETDKKLHQPPDTLRKLRFSSDIICKEYGLSTLETYTFGRSKTMDRAEKRAVERGNSWKFNLCLTIETAMKRSKNKAEFEENLKQQGIKAKWTDSRKNITYIFEDGRSARDDRLYGKKFLKSNMELEFKIREENLSDAVITGWEFERDKLYEQALAPATRPSDTLVKQIMSTAKRYEQASDYDNELEEIANLAALTALSFVGVYLLLDRLSEITKDDLTDEILSEIVEELKQEPENCIEFEDEQEQQGFTMTM